MSTFCYASTFSRLSSSTLDLSSSAFFQFRQLFSSIILRLRFQVSLYHLFLSPKALSFYFSILTANSSKHSVRDDMFQSIERTLVMNSIERPLRWSDSLNFSVSSTLMLFSQSKEMESLSAIQICTTIYYAFKFQIHFKLKPKKMKPPQNAIFLEVDGLSELTSSLKQQQRFLLLMRQQREEEAEYDVYYRGTKEELYAFLYPLTGPRTDLFDHLETVKTTIDVEKKQFEMKYEPKDFENIDKQKEDIIYKSTLLPTQSNYFYSVFQPEQNCFVWQSIDNFVEMRPKAKGTAIIKEEDKEKQKQKEKEEDKAKIELDVIEYDNKDNKARELINDILTPELKENWEVSKDEYLIHLAK